MKSLTVKQPWAWSIMHGKRIENRGWQRPWRGTLAIHAGKGWDLDGEVSPLVRRAWYDSGHAGPMFGGHPDIPVGAVVAVADLVGICSDTASSYTSFRCGCGPWAASGQYHWKLKNVTPLAEPVPCRGALGLWTLPADVESAVVAQLGERTNA